MVPQTQGLRMRLKPRKEPHPSQNALRMSRKTLQLHPYHHRRPEHRQATAPEQKIAKKPPISSSPQTTPLRFQLRHLRNAKPTAFRKCFSLLQLLPLLFLKRANSSGPKLQHSNNNNRGEADE